MTLSAGARLGPYEILSLVGVGGMGEVYRGRDTRLDRTVAIKLLPVEMAERPDRRARFEVEARAISSLSHPHICTLFDVGDQDGRPFIVMEYLAGETLDDRLTRGALAAKEVVRYALQIADALAHAHRAHIVHRDLKPSNVMLTASGSGSTAAPQAKLLDFGLARRPVVEAAAGTLSTVSFDQRKLTAEGTILGTFQYMAPEQLEGKEADARTDIFAFGTLIYEMATGKKAFEGTSQASLIASILTAQPPAISSTQSSDGLPPAIDHIVERCLAKNPDDRWQTARDLKLELEWIAAGSQVGGVVAPASTPRARRRELLAWAVALVALAAAIAGAVMGRPRPSNNADVTRFVIAPASGSSIRGGEQRMPLAVSPDGRHIAYVGVTEGQTQIWVRSLDKVAAQLVPGTEGASSPFWSPDGKYIGFLATDRGELRKVALAGGPPRTICPAANETLPEWGTDGTILFTQLLDGVFRVSAEGGTPTRVTAVDKSQREINHFWPTFLPDGKHFLYLATARNSDNVSKALPSLYIAALDGSKRTLVPRIHSRTIYAATGYLLFVEEGALLAQPFDLPRLQVKGEAIRVADGVALFRSIGSSSFSVSTTGTLAYLGAGDQYQFQWYDRAGNATDPGWAKQTYGSVRISPDGQQALVDVYDPRNGESDVWIYDLARNVPRRFIADPPSDRNGVWSPDARRVLYSTERGFFPNLFTKAFDGSGEIETMVAYPAPVFPDDWSSDNQWIVFTVNTVQTFLDLWLKPLRGDGEPRKFLATSNSETGARFSPDAKWVAFSSDETNSATEVFVAPVGQPERRRQISIGGGTAPRWRRDGKELFYASADARWIMSVTIDSLAEFRVGKPTRLFTVGMTQPVVRDGNRGAVYDVTPGGDRFLVSLPYGEPLSSRINVLLNWTAALNRN
jgi:eukaryotic-like serine/threonine-protein kinase